MRNNHVSQQLIFLDMGLTFPSNHLIDWLNANQGGKRHSRLLDLLRGIRNAERAKTRMFKDAHEGGKVDSRAHRNLADLFEQLNKTFSNYKVFPHLGVIQDGGWPTYWMPVKAGVFNTWIKGKGREQAVREVAECNAVLTLVSLLRNGRLARLRECKECGKWFYAKPWHKRFCTSDCQVKHFRSTAKFKKAHKLYMRRRRRDENLRAQTALQWAREGH